MAKKSTLSKIVSGIVSVVLLGGIIVGSIALAQNVDFRVKQPEEQTEQEKGKDEGNIIVSDDNLASALSIKLTRIAAPIASQPVGSENHLSYKITATYDGESTTDKLDLSVAWANPSSSWATGKNVTDYLELQHEDGAFEAIATAKQAYAETIVLTGKIRNRDITKSINLDYLAKPTTINNNIGYELQSISETFKININDSDYELGSVKPSKITGTVKLSLPVNVYNALKGKGWNELQQDVTISDYNLLAPTDVKINYVQFMGKQLAGDELSRFNYDLYWALNEVLSGDALCLRVSVSANYYAQVNGVETLCGQFADEQDFQINSYEELQKQLTDFDFGGDILFY